MNLANTIRSNYQRVVEQIAASAHAAGRDPGEVKLVVVTKGQPLSVVQAVVAAGARHIGENYPAEALPKMLGISAEFGVQWHMIGHIQSRKARIVAENFNSVHSLDRLKLARRLQDVCAQAGKRLPVLLEMNVSAEPTKHGWVAHTEANWPELLPEIQQVVDFPNLEVRGLMTMAPFAADSASARPYFDRLRRLRDFLAIHFPRVSWQDLSMGMSGDFEPAVRAGATFVRIGRAILGDRHN
ncbi:MAG: YggS family pyridoxal phosphate-dependent enzyme [Anaerolineae bacterium]|nr:YggS family pyridoxal phosphate-dependent enzyme [Anaerolineae bacterium]